MTFEDEMRFRRRWKRRRVWMGTLGSLLVVLTLVSFGLESFKENERYSTVDARETMDTQTPGEVQRSREDFDNRDILVSTVPPSLLEGDGPTEARLEVEPSSGDRIQISGPGDDSNRSSPALAKEPTAQSEKKTRSTTGVEPPWFSESLSPTSSESLSPISSESLSPTSSEQDLHLEKEESEPFSNPYVTSPSLPDEMFDAVLLIGADAGGKLADTIMLVILPKDGSAPALVSIPRDLYLPNSCTNDYRRVNATLGGCRGGVSGAELLAVVVEDFTGVAVDHYVRIDFEGFVELVDGLGGIEICFDHPTFDRNAQLDIGEEGCPMADGATSLAYARSRNARQLVDGEWQAAWSSDSVRQKHQRELLLKLASSLRESGLLSKFQGLSHTFRLDSGWSITEAVEWAWRYRDLDLSLITQLKVSVDDHTTPSGGLVAVPTRPFNEILAEWRGSVAG